MEKLAIDGGPKAKTTPNIHMFPGGMEIGDEERAEIMEVLDHKYLFRYYGPEDFPSKVRQLEVDFASLIGTKYALAVNSCTSALISSLVACGVGPGDEVIVPGYTFFASAASILAAKAIPIIAEVDDSLTLDPADFEAKITPQTKAVIPVHMRGAPCDMDSVMAIARRHGIKVIEDVAQACGGSYRSGMRTSNIERPTSNSEIPNPKSPMRSGEHRGLQCVQPPVPQDHHLGRGRSHHDRRRAPLRPRSGLSRHGGVLAARPLRPAEV